MKRKLIWFLVIPFVFSALLIFWGRAVSFLFPWGHPVSSESFIVVDVLRGQVALEKVLRVYGPAGLRDTLGCVIEIEYVLEVGMPIYQRDPKTFEMVLERVDVRLGSIQMSIGDADGRIRLK